MSDRENRAGKATGWNQCLVMPEQNVSNLHLARRLGVHEKVLRGCCTRSNRYQSADS
jgi:hypothetical protein